MYGKIRNGIYTAAMIACGIMGALQSQASQTQFNTAPGDLSSGGFPLNAMAVLTTNDNGTVDIKLSNLIVNPTAANQNISSFYFSLNDGAQTGTLGSSFGIARIINGDDTYSDGGSIPTGWLLSSSGGVFHLDDLNGAAGPAHTILGSPGAGGLYSNANGSLHTGSHNPFLAGPVDFLINIDGVTSNTQVTSAVFAFGTTSGDNHPGTPVPGPTPTPEAGSVLSLGCLLMGGAAGLWLRRKKRAYEPS